MIRLIQNATLELHNNYSCFFFIIRVFDMRSGRLVSILEGHKVHFNFMQLTPTAHACMFTHFSLVTHFNTTFCSKNQTTKSYDNLLFL